MSMSSHVTELRKKHDQLDKMISSEQRAPGSNDLEISQLKRQKLKLKEEIERASSQHA